VAIRAANLAPGHFLLQPNWTAPSANKPRNVIEFALDVIELENQ
jgi:hypothetical protein